jgi:hypothetical protein
VEYESFVNDTNNLPKCGTLLLYLQGNCHGFAPSTLRLLRKCNSVKKFKVCTSHVKSCIEVIYLHFHSNAVTLWFEYFDLAIFFSLYELIRNRQSPHLQGDLCIYFGPAEHHIHIIIKLHGNFHHISSTNQYNIFSFFPEPFLPNALPLSLTREFQGR